MIRETCSCGAEFESDLPEQIALVKQWRKTHKHPQQPIRAERADISITSDTQVALGFQPTYNPTEEEYE